MLDDWIKQATPITCPPTNIENHRAKRKAKLSPKAKQTYKKGNDFAKKN